EDGQGEDEDHDRENEGRDSDGKDGQGKGRDKDGENEGRDGKDGQGEDEDRDSEGKDRDGDGEDGQSMILDKDVTNEVQLYLQSIGADISGRKLMDFLNDDEFWSRHGIEKPINIRTAQRYLNTLGYRYSGGISAKGWRIGWRVSYLNLDHQFKAVVSLHGFMMNTYSMQMTGNEKDDFVSADFGWLSSPDQRWSARRVMKPGENRDGYFTNEDVIDQAKEAIKILRQFYPEYDHVLIYDNATTHLKRAEDALSARHMPKNTPKPGNNWGVPVANRNPETGKVLKKSNGKTEMVKIQMHNAYFLDGTLQPLYFPEGHERAGVFKGMAHILEERGFVGMSKVRAECKSFKCAPKAENCCCRCILFNQPDFLNVKSALEMACGAKGVHVLFLPKFHCELNFIEQCWGYAKRVYCLNPPSSREDHLERNALAALAAVPLKSMRKFANRSRRFMDVYETGLNGRQAAWAARKYKGHRVLPVGIMEELGKLGIV
ncbi:hypothetical protein CVT25_006561, partial [Psilocybe cyanescens]